MQHLNEVSEDITIKDRHAARQMLLWDDELHQVRGTYNIIYCLTNAKEFSFPGIYLGQFRVFNERAMPHTC